MTINRRDVLVSAGTAMSVGSTGCLRLAGNSEGTSGGSENTFNVQRFQLHILTRNPDELLEEPQLGITPQESDAESIAGSWSGDNEIMTSQTCARYVVEITEDGSPIASTGEQILTYYYRYAVRQTADSLFITSHPSVDSSWDIGLRLTYPNDEYTLSPSNRLSEGAFEFDLTSADVENGRYQWSFDITPPGGYTINIGTFNEDTLVSVDPSSTTEFPTRAEAIDTVASLSTASANALEIPSDTTGNQIQFDDGGHNGGTIPDSDYGRELSRDVALSSDPAIEFGSEVNRRLRVRNLTTGQELIFVPS